MLPRLRIATTLALFFVVIFTFASLLLIPAAVGQSTARLAPSDDSWVEYEYPNTNHGLETVLRVKADSRIRRSYLKFDLSSIPTGKVITSVKLFLYCTVTDLTPVVTMNAHETVDSWSQSSITWNNAPAVGSLIVNTTVGGTGQYYSWDITPYGDAQYQGDKILSVVVKFPLDNPSQNNPNYARDFASKEYSGTFQDPYLEVTYDNSPPTAYFTYSPTYPVVNDTVTFNASTSYDPDGFITSYMWDFGDNNITTVADPIIAHVYSTYANYTVTLTITDNDGLTDSYLDVVEVVDPAILRVSLPEGAYVKQNTGDPWIDEGWLLNQTGNSWSFTLKIYDTSKSIKSYDTHLIIALNEAAHNNLQSLTINGTSITSFTNGRPKPYGTKYWSDCVYPTWFNDSYKDIGLILPKGSKTLVVSATFSDATNARMHFDAYGSIFNGTPCGWSQVTWSPHSEDSTVRFSAPLEQYYLTVKTDPLGIVTIPGEGWYAKFSNVSLTAPSVVSGLPGSHYRFNYWDVDGASRGLGVNPIYVYMDANHTATAHYVVQYNVTFTQTGLSPDATGLVVTVDGEPHTFGNLPLTMWIDTGHNVTYSYNSPVSSSASGKRFLLVSVSGPSSPVNVTGSVTITGNYKTQYQLTVRTSGLGATVTNVYNNSNILGTATDAMPYTSWFDQGSPLQLNIDSPITVGSKKFVFTYWTGDASGTSRPLPVTMSSAKDITANYKTQYKVTFNQTGVDTDFTETVVTVDLVGYTRNQLPQDFWWDENSDHDFTFASPLVVNAGKQYVWVSTSGLSTLQSGTLHVTTSGNVIGNYTTEVKYQITFNQTGVGPDFTGTVVTIDGIDYVRSALPVSFWWDTGSMHNFTFYTPLVVTLNAKQYVWNSTSGLSTLRNGSITVSMSGSVIGNYKTQYYLTVTSPYGTRSGERWYYEGDVAYAGLDTGTFDHGNGTRRVFTNWNGDASGTNYAQSNSIIMNGPKTALAVWKTQYKVSFTQTGSAVAPTVTYTADIDPIDTVPFDVWVKAGTEITYEYQNITLGPTGTRYVLISTNPPSPQTVNSPLIIVGTYKTQYLVTFQQTGLDSTANSVVVTFNSVSKSYGDLPNSTWFDNGYPLSYSYYNVSSSVAGKRFILIGVTGPASPFSVSGSVTITGNYKTQFYLTLATNPPSVTTPSGQGWYDAETLAPISTSQYVDIVPGSARYRFSNWTTADMTEITNSTSPSTTVRMDKAKTVTANYITQYYLTVTSPYAMRSGEGWYDRCSTAYAGLSAGIVEHSNRTRHVFTGWGGDASGTNYAQSDPILMDGPKTAVANWKTQYLLAVRTEPVGLVPQPSRNPLGDPDTLFRGWWYDSSTSVELTAPDPSYWNTAKYNFTNWKVDGNNAPGNPITVQMNQPHEAVAYYKAQPPVGGVTVAISTSTSTNGITSLATWISFVFAMISTIVATAVLAKSKTKRK